MIYCSKVSFVDQLVDKVITRNLPERSQQSTSHNIPLPHNLLKMSFPSNIMIFCKLLRINLLISSYGTNTRPVERNRCFLIFNSIKCKLSEWHLSRKLKNVWLLPPSNDVLGKVMFLLLSVSHSVHGGSLCDVISCLPSWSQFLLMVSVSGSIFLPGGLCPGGGLFQRFLSRGVSVRSPPMVKSGRYAA